MNLNVLFLFGLCLIPNWLLSQNVGINTTGATPTATNLLEVLSTSTTASSIGIYAAHSGAIAGTGYGIWIQKTGASTTNIAGYFTASGATNNYAIIVPASGGSVGIGTTSPESKLEVQGEEGADAALTLDADDGDDNADTWFIKSQAADNDLTFTNHTSELMRITYGGRVAIGTTTPSTLVHLKGSHPSIRIEPTSNANQQASVEIRAYNDGDGFSFGRDGGNSGGHDFFIYDQVAGAFRMSINSSGNIGFGTTTEQSKIDVEGNMAIGATYSGTTAAPSNGLIVEGNVGIGTSSPGEKLEVNGNVKATAFYATTNGAGAYKYNSSTNMNVPDYVFEKYYDNNKTNNPEYSMMKLTDLEKYLQKNKHLPRVPSREEILKDKRVNLQGLGMMSLEKIEETTLYVIELENKVKNQQKEIEQQKQLIEEIKNVQQKQQEQINLLLKKE